MVNIDPESVQYHLCQKRHSELMSILRDLEMANAKEDSKIEVEVVRAKIVFLDKLLRYSYLQHSGSCTNTQAQAELGSENVRDGKGSKLHPEGSAVPKRSVSDTNLALGQTTHFKNRFIVHNLQLKWHNDVRNI